MFIGPELNSLASFLSTYIVTSLINDAMGAPNSVQLEGDHARSNASYIFFPPLDFGKALCKVPLDPSAKGFSSLTRRLSASMEHRRKSNLCLRRF